MNGAVNQFSPSVPGEISTAINHDTRTLRALSIFKKPPNPPEVPPLPDTLVASITGEGTMTLAGTATASAFFGPLTGSVTGSVAGNVSGNLTGNSTGNHFGPVRLNGAINENEIDYTGWAQAGADGSASFSQIFHRLPGAYNGAGRTYTTIENAPTTSNQCPGTSIVATRSQVTSGSNRIMTSTKPVI